MKLTSIICVRSLIWINGLVLMHNTEYFYTLLLFTMLFVSLDIFWVTILVGNILKSTAVKTVNYIKKNKHKLSNKNN